MTSLVIGNMFGQGYTISTFAGGARLPANIPGTSANIHPASVAVDAAGNVFFGQGDVLRLDAKTGVLTLVAGNGTPGFNGDNILAANAQMSGDGIALDAAGNLFIADAGNNRIRKISNGVITTVAGNGTPGYGGDNGPATSAQLSNPVGVAFDAAGNLYIADWGNFRVRKISNGVITTVAGDGTPGFGGDNGPATRAWLYFPQGVAVDASGNLYIADSGNKRVRKVSNGLITTVAGGAGGLGDNIPATLAELENPDGVAVDSAGRLYIADSSTGRIRKVENGVIATVAGNGTLGYSGDNGPATSAQLASPAGVAVNTAGNLYIADSGNGRVRRVAKGLITTVAGGGDLLGNNGPAISANLSSPNGIATDAAGNLYIADSSNCLVRKIANGTITTVAGNGTGGYSGDNGAATNAQLNYPDSVAVDSTGSLYIADSNNNRIRKVSGGIITTVAGGGSVLGDDGPAISAYLSFPQGIAVDTAGNVYIADTYHYRIRKVSSGTISTVAGNGTPGFSGDGGPATSASIGAPNTVALDGAGNLYIADGNNRIRKVSGGVITTVVGSGVCCSVGDNGPATSAWLVPSAVSTDPVGNLYIADMRNNLVRRVSGGMIATVAGSGVQGFGGDGGPAVLAEFYDPAGVALDAGGNIYVADSVSNRIRLLTPGTPPAITQGAIVPNDGTVSAIQSGSWISIFGSNLANKTAIWNGDFPQSLGGTSVTVDNRSAYLWYVSPQQINLQVPDDAATGIVEVVVKTASGTASSTVTLATYAPSFSLLGDGKHVAGEILTFDGSGAYGGGTYDLVGPSNTFSYNTRPVKAGETLVLYGVGFGPTTPVAPAGHPYSGGAQTNTPVAVTIGGVSAHVAFGGMVEAGLYQLNVTVPPNTGSGDLALLAAVNGVQTAPGPVVTVQ